MSLRAGHGRGAGFPHIEVLPPDEQPPPQAAGADPLATGRDAAKRVRTTAAARALAKLPRKSRYLPRRLACDPRFEPHNRRRLEWQRRRLAELQTAHGGVSHGVGALVNAAAWMFAGGEFAAELAAESGDVDGFKSAGTLSGMAQSRLMAAWEQCALEAKARPRPNALAEFFGAPLPPEASEETEK